MARTSVALWLLGLLVLLGGCELAPARHATRLVMAESVATGEQDVEPAPGARWEPTALPDNWDGRRSGYEGFVRYRLRFEAPPEGRVALYLPSVGMNGYPILNGVALGAFGRMVEPLTRHFYTPLLWELPRPLLREGSNELVLVVVGHAGYRCGLAPVEIGAHESLYAAWQLRRAVQNTGTLVTSTITGALGMYVLLLWLRERSNPVFGWFGVAALVWAMRNLNYVVTEPWLGSLLWSQLTVAGAGAFQALFAIFTLHYCHSVDPLEGTPRWVPAALLAYAALTLLWFVSAADVEQARRGFVPLALTALGITAWGQWRLLRLARRHPGAETLSIAGSGLVYLALALHDLAIARNLDKLGEVYLRHYASLPLFFAIGWMLTRRYLDALSQARDATASLRTQVRAQRSRLERNFRRLREAEREQAGAAERERLVRELHDGLGANLIAAVEQCRRAEASRETIADTLQDCLTDLRVAIDSLASDERDPLAVLGNLRFRMAPRLEAMGIALRWEVGGEVPEIVDLDPAHALHLLRIVQEALTNVFRHSRAHSVVLRVEARPGRVRVIVRDDGHGFRRGQGELDSANPGKPLRTVPQTRPGRGLANMRERARLLQASLEVESSQSGVEVRLDVPLRRRC